MKYTARPWGGLDKELCGIDEWLKVNKLSLNVNKSKYMLFNAGNKILYPFEIKIDYISIERVYVFNFIGLIMDEHLNCKSHVEQFSNKCSKTIGVLNKLKYVLTLTVKLILYNSLILPHLNYGIINQSINQNLFHINYNQVQHIHNNVERGK